MSNNETVKRQQDIQQEIAAADAKHGGDDTGAMQAGARPYP
ncbi:unnamed protein product, partial [Laminaria digitata]